MSERREALFPDLADMTPLLLPWIRDPWGRERPPVSPEAMRMSVLLAESTYSMELGMWMRAGWRDAVFQLDGALLDGLSYAEGAGRIRRETAVRRRRLVRGRLRRPGAMSVVTDALRQKQQKDRIETGKVLVMAHPVPDGRQVIAVSFMGTGRKLTDWTSNFRMSTRDGIHAGFLQLCEQFEHNGARVSLPETARAMGRESLTLRDVIAEAARPGSPFILWLCGHSQGGAVMEVWCRRRLETDGVLPRCIVGYGFASPTVALGGRIPEPAAYPLYHVANGDDVVPRVGSQVHLGMLLIYRPDDTMRRSCYTWPRSPRADRARELVAPLLGDIAATSDSLAAIAAFLSLLAECPVEKLLTGLAPLRSRNPVLERVLEISDDRADALLRYGIRRARVLYPAIYGHDMPAEKFEAWREKIAPALEELGPSRFLKAMGELLQYWHACCPADGQELGTYPWITLRGFRRLVPACWGGGAQPQLHVLRTDGVQGAVRLINRRAAHRSRRGGRRNSRLPAWRRQRRGRPERPAAPGGIPAKMPEF